MGENVNNENISRYFHIRQDIKERTIPLTFVLDDSGAFHFWTKVDKQIIEIKPINLIEGTYFAHNKGFAGDYYFDFLNFMYQYAFTRDIANTLGCINHDVCNLAASIGKIELIYQSPNTSFEKIKMGITEIEYIIIVCRSLFDLLQDVSKTLWDKNIKMLTPQSTMPSSFQKIAFHGDEINPPETLIAKYGLPRALAEFYFCEADFFKKMRDMRNSIVHYGKTFDQIVLTDKGFAVRTDYFPFAVFDIWKKEMKINEHCISVKPLIAYLIKRTLDALTNYVHLLSREIEFPEPIAPGYSMFIRGAFIDRLDQLDNYIQKDYFM